MSQANYQLILVPTDGSEGAREAARAAADLARLSGGRLIALHVLPPTNAIASYLWLGPGENPVPVDPGWLDNMSPSDDLALRAIEAVARERGVPVDTEQVIDAQPARAIADAAAQRGCDLVVMSSRGYGNLEPLLTDTATSEVVSECAVPVLVVH